MRAEMRHYRAHCTAARDASSLAALRLECASLLADALAIDVSGADVLPSLTDAISFLAYDDARPALDRLVAAGVRLAVVANWDVSLPDVLARLGLAQPFEVIVTAAAIGAAKPDARPFQAALERLGSDAARTRARRRRSRHRHRRRARRGALGGAARPQRPGSRLDREPRRARCPPGARRVTPPVANDARLQVPATDMLIVGGVALVATVFAGVAHSILVSGDDDFIYSPGAMAIIICHVRRDGRSRSVGGAAHRRCAPSARPGRPALVAARARPRARDRRPRAHRRARRWSRSSMAPTRRASSRITGVRPVSGPWPASARLRSRSPSPARSSRS